jgi:NADH-quinone oxidoreductase subunit N
MNNYLLSQLPLLIGFGLLLVLASIWPQKKPSSKTGGSKGVESASQFITLFALALSAWLTHELLMPGDQYFGGAIRVTVIGQAVAYGSLALAFVATLLSGEYLDKIRARAGDFRLLILAQALGLYHLPLAGDLPTLFIAFELVSVPSYVLAGFNHRDARANEAGMKYLLLGAFASVLFLLGLAFLYGATGELRLADIGYVIGGHVLDADTASLLLAKVSLGLLVAALLFKTATAPFHLWLPDVYQGTNLASLGFIAAPVKVAIFGLIALILWGPFAALNETWKPLILIAALACALFGNFQAIVQTRLKRLLAFSTVANAGFILLGLFLDSAGAFLFYLMTYGLTSLGVIACFMALGTRTADLDEVDDLDGLGRRHPWIAGILTFLLFSLAGIPLTAGFAAKFGIASGAFLPGYQPAPWFLPVLVVSIVLSLVSFFFYFKIVRALWLKPAPVTDSLSAPEPRALGFNALLVAAFVALAVLAMGIVMYMPGLPKS